MEEGETLDLLDKERKRIENIYDREEEHEFDQDSSVYSDEEDFDHNNYKGIYINDEPGQKFTDPETGAHFDYGDMCQRLKVIENERKSADGRQQKVQHFDNDSQNQKVNIYKSNEDFLNQNKHNVVKDLKQNKQEMIKKLNQKLDSMFNEDNYNQKQIDCNPSVKTADAKNFSVLNKVNPKAEPNSKNISKERHEKQKKSMNIKNIQKLASSVPYYQNINTTKSGYNILKNNNFVNILSFGDMHVIKNNISSRNSNKRARGAYTIEQNSIQSIGHKKINSFYNLSDRGYSKIDSSHGESVHVNIPHQSNIILENLKLNRNQKSNNKNKSKRFKNKRDSELLLGLCNKYSLKQESLNKDSRPSFPISIKKLKKHDDLIKASKERSSRRKQGSDTKWKLSPYQKKLASKLSKIKKTLNDTPEKQRKTSYLKKKRFTLNEYSNFIHDPNKAKVSQKLSHSRNKIQKEKVDKSTPINYSSVVNASNRGRNKSKGKSDKLIFFTLNNYKA